jgi:hypothetical protein
MSDTENKQHIARQDLQQPKVLRGWLKEFLIYIMLIVSGALLAVASSYIMRKFGL